MLQNQSQTEIRRRTNEVSPELEVRALPPAVGSPRRRQAGLLAEAPDEAVDVQEEQVLQVGLLGSPVEAGRLQPHVVQGHLREERPRRGPGARRGASGGCGGGSTELAVEHEPVERLLVPRVRVRGEVEGAASRPPAGGSGARSRTRATVPAAHRPSVEAMQADLVETGRARAGSGCSP